jgi:hypothetical protein
MINTIYRHVRSAKCASSFRAMDCGEITDKGSINSAVFERRGLRLDFNRTEPQTHVLCVPARDLVFRGES